MEGKLMLVTLFCFFVLSLRYLQPFSVPVPEPDKVYNNYATMGERYRWRGDHHIPDDRWCILLVVCKLSRCL